MKITKKTTYEIIFTVTAYWPTEGGMESDRYGEECDTMEEAITLLEAARISQSDTDWIIECYVEKKEG